MKQNLLQILLEIIFNCFIINCYGINQVKCVYFDALKYSFPVAQYSFLPLLKPKKKMFYRLQGYCTNFFVLIQNDYFRVLMTNSVNLINKTHNDRIFNIYFIFRVQGTFFYYSFSFICTFCAFSFPIQKYAIDFFFPNGEASI